MSFIDDADVGRLLVVDVLHLECDVGRLSAVGAGKVANGVNVLHRLGGGLALLEVKKLWITF